MRNDPRPKGWGILPGTMVLIVLQGTAHLVRSGQGFCTPRTFMLRFIKWYQDNVSAGRDVCPRGPGRNCSNVSYAAVEQFGALRGGLIAVWTVLSCRLQHGPFCSAAGF